MAATLPPAASGSSVLRANATAPPTTGPREEPRGGGRKSAAVVSRRHPSPPHHFGTRNASPAAQVSTEWEGPAPNSTPLAVSRRWKGTTFLKDAEDTSILPRPLPRGITYVSNFTPYSELLDRDILQVDEDEKVHLSTEEVSALYHAKCADQRLQASWQREARFMELVSRQCKGLMFSLRENGLGAQSARCLVDVLARNRYYALVDLSGNRLRDEGAECIADLLERNDSIVHLALKSNDIGAVGGQAIARALEANRTLTSLDLSGISGINRNHLGTKGALALSRSLQLNGVLCILNLGSNGLGKEGIGLLAQGLIDNRTVTDMDLSSNNLGAEGCVILATVLDTANFSTLNLERNFIGDRGCSVLASAFKVPKRACTVLECLNVSNNNIRGSGMRALGEAVGMSQILKVLRLDDNEIGIDGAREMAAALELTKSLQVLSLVRNDLNAEAGRSIAAVLLVNTSLQRLELGENGLGDEGASALFQSLRKAPKTGVTHLDVGDNKIGDPGGVEAAHMIRHNTVLQGVNINKNNIKASGEPIAEALQGNNTLLCLDTTYNDVSYKAFTSIENSLHRNTKLFKATAGDRLRTQIEGLKRDEELLFQTRDCIKEEIRIRDQAKEKVKLKRESLKKTVASLRTNLAELEEELEAKQVQRQQEEETTQTLADGLQRIRIKTERQAALLTRKIESEGDKMQRLFKQSIVVEQTVKQMEASQEELFAPIVARVQEEQRVCEVAKNDAKWEAEKLVKLEFKIKRLEQMLAQRLEDAETAKKKKNAGAASPPISPKMGKEKKKKRKKKA